MQTFFSIQKSLGGYAIISSSYLNIIKCCLTLSVVRMDTSTCKISRWNFSRLLRKQQIILGISFFAAPSIAHWVRNTILGKQNTFSDHDETGAEVDLGCRRRCCRRRCHWSDWTEGCPIHMSEFSVSALPWYDLAIVSATGGKKLTRNSAIADKPRDALNSSDGNNACWRHSMVVNR